jgi:hypothetical protein
VKCAFVGDGEFVRSHGQAAPLLETVDAPLDGVALLVCLRVEAGRTPAGLASPETVSDLVRRLRDDRADASAAKMPADCAR